MTKRIAVNLPDEQYEAIRLAVEQGRASSVSGYISGALARVERESQLSQLLDDLDRECGSLSPDDLAWAERELGLR